jgi:uncharacterized membrane protein
MNRKEVGVKIGRRVNSENFCCSVLSLILSTFPVIEHQDNRITVLLVLLCWLIVWYLALGGKT